MGEWTKERHAAAREYLAKHAAVGAPVSWEIVFADALDEIERLQEECRVQTEARWDANRTLARVEALLGSCGDGCGAQGCDLFTADEVRAALRGDDDGDPPLLSDVARTARLRAWCEATDAE